MPIEVSTTTTQHHEAVVTHPSEERAVCLSDIFQHAYAQVVNPHQPDVAAAAADVRCAAAVGHTFKWLVTLPNGWSHFQMASQTSGTVSDEAFCTHPSEKRPMCLSDIFQHADAHVVNPHQPNVAVSCYILPYKVTPRARHPGHQNPKPSPFCATSHVTHPSEKRAMRFSDIFQHAYAQVVNPHQPNVAAADDVHSSSGVKGCVVGCKVTLEHQAPAVAAAAALLWSRAV
jgi:hypothetical protein